MGTYAQAETADCRQGQAGGSAAAPLLPSSFSPSFPHPSLSERVTVPPSPSPCVSALGPFLPDYFPLSCLRPLLAGQLVTSWPDPSLQLSCSSQLHQLPIEFVCSGTTGAARRRNPNVTHKANRARFATENTKNNNKKKTLPLQDSCKPANYSKWDLSSAAVSKLTFRFRLQV